MFEKNPLYHTDFYKVDHRSQYPEGTELVYSNFTARSAKLSNLPDIPDSVVFFGLQAALCRIVEDWKYFFFQQPRESVVDEYKRFIESTLGVADADVSHIEELHQYGRLPLRVKTLPEGSEVPIGVPMFTVVNTDPRFFWLTNYLETSLSSNIWKAITSATTARWYRREWENHFDRTGGPDEMIGFRCHDFSYRGMSTDSDAAISGLAHLLFFEGTDSIPAIRYAQAFYGADIHAELVGASVPATEHSVMCAGGEEDELETFRRLITDVYPSGIVSIVSDTWDYWEVLTDFTEELYTDIVTRDGKVVFRPDSGDPVKIICGDPEAPTTLESGLHNPVHFGSAVILANVFGYETNDEDFRSLNPKVGLIYGDSITPQRCRDILTGLETKGFRGDCLVLGIGSFTYNYVTRDTYGCAMKCTAVVIDGETRFVQKNPKTDDGTKKSLSGFLRVERGDDGRLFVVDKCENDKGGEMRTIFDDGYFVLDKLDVFSTVKRRAREQYANRYKTT